MTDKEAIQKVREMCEESMIPDEFEYYVKSLDGIVDALKKVRKGLQQQSPTVTTSVGE